MSHILGLSRITSSNYSPNNKYLREYNNLLREFENVQFQARNCKDSKRIKALESKQERLEEQLPVIAKKVEKEENRLESSTNGQHKINYLA